MTRFFLLIGLVCAVWWILRASQRSGRRRQGGSIGDKPVERMVECARCGVNQPLSESIVAKGRYYCCIAHLRDAESSDD